MPVVRLELLDEPVDDPVVPVVATEVVVTRGRADLDHAVADLEQRHVERAATEVEDQDGLLLLALVQAVGQRGRGRLVDDAQHVETGDLAGFLGGLALGVLEVGGDGDHRIGDVLAEVALGVALQLLQHARADLLRGVLLAVDLNGPVGAHVALDRTDRAVDVGHRLVLGGLPDEHLAVLARTRRRTGWCASPPSWRPRRVRHPRARPRPSWWSRGRFRPHEPWCVPPVVVRLQLLRQH